MSIVYCKALQADGKRSPASFSETIVFAACKATLEEAAVSAKGLLGREPGHFVELIAGVDDGILRQRWVANCEGETE